MGVGFPENTISDLSIEITVKIINDNYENNNKKKYVSNNNYNNNMNNSGKHNKRFVDGNNCQNNEMTIITITTRRST